MRRSMGLRRLPWRGPMKKSPTQLDREIAAALVEARIRAPTVTDKVEVLRLKLPRGLDRTVSRTQHLLFSAVRRTSSGYTFEASDINTIRALWRALTEIYYHPSRSTPNGVWRVAGKKLAEVRPFIAASWPEALAE